MSNPEEIIAVAAIPVERARDVRHRILRPNQPPEACIYPNDDAPDTGHFGAFQDGALVGIASVFHETLPQDPELADWRIRGMATEAAVRGKGYGGLLVEEVIAYVASQNGKGIWCNARTGVMGFYDKYGFAPQGKEFELPGIGPHYLMIRSIF